MVPPCQYSDVTLTVLYIVTVFMLGLGCDQTANNVTASCQNIGQRPSNNHCIHPLQSYNTAWNSPKRSFGVRLFPKLNLCRGSARHIIKYIQSLLLTTGSLFKFDRLPPSCQEVTLCAWLVTESSANLLILLSIWTDVNKHGRHLTLVLRSYGVILIEWSIESLFSESNGSEHKREIFQVYRIVVRFGPRGNNIGHPWPKGEADAKGVCCGLGGCCRTNK